MKLDLVPLPVVDVDVDVAKALSVDRLGFVADVDAMPTPGVRVVQLTPPGSTCSVSLSTGLPRISSMAPGSVQGVHLVVQDVAAERTKLVERGVDVREVEDVGGGGCSTPASPTPTATR